MGLLTAIPERRDSLAYPRPCRFSQVAAAEALEINATVDLVDLLYTKVGVADQGDASTEFFCGSPPTRTSNPVVDDPLFGVLNPLNSINSGLPKSPTPPARTLYAQAKSGFFPAVLRVEGFDCHSLGQDSPNRVSASA